MWKFDIQTRVKCFSVFKFNCFEVATSAIWTYLLSVQFVIFFLLVILMGKFYHRSYQYVSVDGSIDSCKTDRES